MATYNYYSNPYQSPYQAPYYQPTYQTPMMTQPFQTVQTPTTTPVQTAPTASQSSIIWVASEQEAAMYPIAPNNAVTLWNQNEPVVYLKQSDASGKPSMKTYDLVERVEAPQSVHSGVDGKPPVYATKDDLAAVVGAVNGLDGALATFKGEIETIKGDLYGIAGKKKTTKKQEVADDE